MSAGGYQRLSRRRRTVAGSSELWLDGDQILLVMRHWWTERYHRFRLADIQSIIVTERDRSRLVPELLGLAFAGVLLILSVIPPLSWKMLAAVPLVVVVVMLIVDVARGPRCRVHLNTEVSSVLIPALSRMHAAGPFLERVIPLIEQAQAGIAVPPPPLPGEQPLIFDTSPLQAQPPVLPAPPAPLLTLILPACMLLLGCLGLGFLWGKVSNQLATLNWLLSFSVVVLGGVVAFTRDVSGWIRMLAILMAVVGVIDVVASLAMFGAAVQAATNGTPAVDAALNAPFAQAWGPVLCYVEIGLGAAGLATALIVRMTAEEHG